GAAGMHAFGDDAHRIGGDGLFALGGGHLHALGFADDLGGDDEDVAGSEGKVGIGGGLGLDGGGDQGDEIVTGGDFGQAGNAPDGETGNHGWRILRLPPP